MDYITHWKSYSSMYALSILCLIFVFTPIYGSLITITNVIFIPITIVFCIFFYSRNITSALHIEPMSRYDYKYLTTKLLDVLMQQMIIYLLFYVTNQSLVLFSAIFALVHVHLFINKKLLSVIIFMIIALILSFIFFTLYTNLGVNGFGAAYFIHMSIYLIGGAVFRYIYRVAM